MENDIFAEFDKLQKEDKELPDGFEESVLLIEGLNRGFPPLLGEAAEHYSVMRNVEIDDGKTKGYGEFGTLNPVNLETLMRIASKAKTEEEKESDEPQPAPVEVIENATPVNQTNLAPVQLTREMPEVQRARTDTADKDITNYSKMKKAELIALLQDRSSQEVCNDVVIYVNCVPFNFETKNLSEYVDRLCGIIREELKTGDIRCSNASVLEFGKWKGVLSDLAKNTPLDPGHYVAYDDELTKVVVRAINAKVVVGTR